SSVDLAGVAIHRRVSERRTLVPGGVRIRVRILAYLEVTASTSDHRVPPSRCTLGRFDTTSGRRHRDRTRRASSHARHEHHVPMDRCPAPRLELEGADNWCGHLPTARTAAAAAAP